MDRTWSAISGRWVATSVLGLVLLVANPAQGSTIIYSNLGPGGSFDTGTFWPIGFVGPTSEYETAVSFIPGFDATLDSFRVATRFSAGTNDFSFYLASDLSGLPGAAIETFAGVQLTPQASLLTLTSLSNPTLLAGTKYWLVGTAPDLSASTGTWFGNDQDLVGGVANRVNGGNWFPDFDATPAFEVNGSPTADVPVTRANHAGVGWLWRGIGSASSVSS